MTPEQNNTASGAPAAFTTTAEFKAAIKAAKRHAPGTWEQLATLLIRAGHASALADVLPHLVRDSGRPPLVRPNNAREVERLMKYAGRMGHGTPKPAEPSQELPEVGGEPMGSYHPPEPTEPPFGGKTRGEYFAEKTARQNATRFAKDKGNPTA